MDGKYVISHIGFARDLLNIEEPDISFLEVKLSPSADENAVREKIHGVFGDEVIIKNRIQQNEGLYKMLNTENLAVYLICTLVLIIALFNMIGSIIMVILDKRENAKTLFNMGATIRQIKRIFFLQGILMTFLGGSLGILVGVIIVVLQLEYDLVMITPSLPYPIALTWLNFLIVFATIMFLGIGASYIGSNRVKKALVD
jgi:lipoprotein-releasing system permease protein